MVCDWLLATRTEIWEKEQSNGERENASQTELIAFQQDLSSLRKLAQENKAALPRVSELNDMKDLVFSEEKTFWPPPNGRGRLI